MKADSQRVCEIFVAALKVAPGARDAYLASACGEDQPLRHRLDDLLRAHADIGTFLEPAVPIDAIDMPLAERPGTIIGPYKLLERIGDGGMGVVFLAEQERPVRRKVALKVIKPGLDTEQVIARFEAERQALALMDHPFIAKVFDGGTTDAGRPFFAMELVRGVPITGYCDQCQLTTRERLVLLIGVCRAVQHAHQKGIIHRDIKPSNVLVVMQDGQGAPKVIDFGVAKAINQRLTEQTLESGFAQMIGTPLYMSPEQAEMSPLEIDTRGDIYSLGVLLYELLTGATPFEAERFKEVGFDELRRIIREEEPPRPSARISTLAADALSTIADHRRMEPRHLAQAIRGDLDWIAMKCLEKDRNRRYATASDLATDLQRYLDDEPVQARPPSLGYRFQKLAKRNKAGIAVTFAVVVAVLLSLVGLAVNNRLVTQEKEQKEGALARAVQEKRRADSNLGQAREAVKKYLLKASENPLLQTADFLELRRELLETALPFYEDFLRQQQDDPSMEVERGRAHEDLAFLRYETGHPERSLADLQRAETIFRRLREQSPESREHLQRLGEILNSRGNSLHELGRFDLAEASFRQALAIFDQLTQQDPAAVDYRDGTARTANNLAVLLRDSSRHEEAEALLRRAIAIREALIVEQPARQEFRGQVAQVLVNLGTVLSAQRRADEAEQAYLRAIKFLDQNPLPVKFDQIRARVLNNLGIVYREGGRFAESEKVYREAVAVKERQVASFPSVPLFRQELARSFSNLGVVLSSLDETGNAQAAYEASITLYEHLVANNGDVPQYAAELAGTYNNLGRLLGDNGQLEQSLPILAKGIETLEATFSLDARMPKTRESLQVAHWTRATTLAGLSRFSESLADWDRAIELDAGQYHNDLRLKRASALLNIKDHTRAVADAEAVAGSADAAGEDLYLAASVYAVSIQFAQDDRRLAESYAARAVQLLRQAVATGLDDSARIRNDSALSSLLSREDFEDLVEDVEIPRESVHDQQATTTSK